MLAQRARLYQPRSLPSLRACNIVPSDFRGGAHNPLISFRDAVSLLHTGVAA